MMKRIMILLVVGILSAAGSAAAQDTPPVEPQAVQLTAADGLVLVGDYYSMPVEAGQQRPAVLLLHMLNSQRRAWNPLITPLLDAGYNVLAVDMRGHGETGSTKDWDAAIQDTQLWLDWLHNQPDVQPDGVSSIGASIGSNLALIGCANDATCATAIALSPGLEYLGVKLDDTVTQGFSNRGILLVAGRRDTTSAVSVTELTSTMTSEVSALLFTGSSHGTAMLTVDRLKQVLIPEIITWLDTHTPAAQ
ncbi:MAG: alpha/beta fold hydrolase [Anaerolineae bacterium]|nr:alpha/beta fold hydrolase [Anaerolineae bacterium]